MSNPTFDVLLKQLKNPFDPKFVKWRVGATNADKTKGIAIAYIDSREVSKRLDDVMGIENWKKKLTGVDGGFTCELLLRLDKEWIGKENAAGNTKVEPLKGGASDAFKRAAADWGVGRYLYYLPTVWVPIKPQGKSYALAEVPELPDWAKPDHHIERWEEVAERELAPNSGADTEFIDNDSDGTQKELDLDSAATLINAAENQRQVADIIRSLAPELQKQLVGVATVRLREVANAS
jgi:hypothetical protein